MDFDALCIFRIFLFWSKWQHICHQPVRAKPIEKIAPILFLFTTLFYRHWNIKHRLQHTSKWSKNEYYTIHIQPCSLMLECHLDGINKYMVLICIFCKSGEVHVVVGFLCFTCQNFMFYLCKTFILWLYDPCVSVNVFYLIIIIFGY